MDIFKIVFTGGPCAGKTTQINIIKEYLKKKGYKVICIGETATEIMTTEMDFKFVNSVVTFQTLMLKTQYFKESIVNDILKNRNEKIIVLFDRGILDNKAYFDNSKDFDYIINNIDKSEIELLDSYDLVIDLLSLASCKPSGYTLVNNKIRTETIEEAIKLDEKTSNVWVGHKNLYLYNSNVSIEEESIYIIKKIEEVINNRYYNEKKTFEINNTITDFMNYNDNNSRTIEEEKITLDNGYIIYRRLYKGSVSYLLEINKEEKNIRKMINFNDYMELINKYNILDVEKYTSLNFVRNKQLFEIKFYDDKTILEYEENKLNNDLIIPEEINVCKEKKKVLV